MTVAISQWTVEKLAMEIANSLMDMRYDPSRYRFCILKGCKYRVFHDVYQPTREIQRQVQAAIHWTMKQGEHESDWLPLHRTPLYDANKLWAMDRVVAWVIAEHYLKKVRPIVDAQHDREMLLSVDAI